MNPTIEKIIDLLFADMEVNDETRAIQEEVRANCQERFDDLRAQGLSEDDAISAVMESLRGMEETLKPYAHKEEAAAEPVLPGERTFDPVVSPIREIALQRMGSVNVKLCPSHDTLVRIFCDDPDFLYTAAVSDGVLLVKPLKEEMFESSAGNLNEMFGQLFRHFRFSKSDHPLCVAIPAGMRPALSIKTASGDVEARDLTLDSLQCATASGDVSLTALCVQGGQSITTASGDVEMTHCTSPSLNLNTASGDLSFADCHFEHAAHILTVSGDIELTANVPELNVKTTSGDMELDGSFESVHASSVSGDCSVRVQDTALHKFDVKSVSGDVSLALPSGLAVNVDLHTLAGSIRQHRAAEPSAPLTLHIQTTTGDIAIH